MTAPEACRMITYSIAAGVSHYRAADHSGHTSCRVQIRVRAFTHGGVWTLALDVRCQHRHELQK